MKIRPIKNKLLTVLLTLCMMLSLVPMTAATAFAANTTIVTNETELTAALNNADCTEIKLGSNIETTGKLYVERTVTFDLNGHTLSCSSENTGIIWVRKNGNLAIKDSGTGGKIDGQEKNCGIFIKGGVLTLESGSIVNCYEKIIDEYSGDGAAVDLETNGQFIMNGGAIEDCRAGDDGGAIDIDSGCTFIMNGGTIKNCKATKNGGAVIVKDKAKFEMNDGLIEGCSVTTTDGTGGGVYIANVGRFVMSGGTIKDCTRYFSDYYGYIGDGVAGETFSKAEIVLKGGTFDNCGTFACTIDTHTVTFDSNGGSDVDQQEICNTSAIKPSDPKKDGYDFAGWYLGDTQYTFDTKITTDFTLKAHWTPTSASTAITAATIQDVNFNYQPGDAPRATAAVAAADQGKYRIYDEWWQELNENDEPVAIWHSDDGIYSTLPTITAFESGKKYVYSILLLPERGYDFAREVAATVNGSTVTAVPGTDGYLSLPNVKTITPTAITQVNIESLYNYGVGDIPRKTAELFDEEADKYEIAYECWEEMENGNPVAFWYSDENKYIPSMKKITQFEAGKDYMYSIELRAKAEYTFADNCVVRINVMPQSTVIKTQNGLFIPAIDTIHPATPKEIETVEINNATLSFKDGDKPIFTGSVPDGAKYVLAFEEWKTDGEWTRSDEWFNDADHHGNDKDITAFDKNKTYQYNLYIKLTAKAGEAGWVFGPNTVLKINGKEVSYTYQSSEENENNYRYSFGVATDLTMTPQPSEVAHDYKIIEGANGVWTQNSNDILTFRANGEFQNFTGIKVDDKLITADEYDVTSNSMIITLKKDYLNTLSIGKHILTVLYNNGECSTEFEIKAASTVPSPTNPDNNSIVNTPNENKPNSGKIASPKTGDTSNMLLWLLFVGGSIAIGTMVVSRKKKYNK